MTLVDFRLRRRLTALKKIKIAALVGLADMVGKQRAVAARIFRRRRLPGGLAAGEFSVADEQMGRALSTSISSPVCTLMACQDSSK